MLHAMERVAVIGNSGGGKSSLASAMAARRRLPYVEADALLWRPGWKLVPAGDYEVAHERAIAAPDWVIDGLGRRETIPARLARAFEIVLVDMPLAVHLELAKRRHRAWERGTLEHPPGGLADAPPLEALLRTIHEVDREWMPDIRLWVAAAASRGTQVVRITSLAELDAASTLVAAVDGKRTAEGA